MAGIHKITRALKNIDENLIEKIITDGDIINVIQRMDDLLDVEAKYKVLDSCACCTKSSKARDKECREYGKVMMNKSFEEKISGLGSIGFNNVTLYGDNVLKVSFCWVIDGKRHCSCGAVNIPIISSKMLLKDKNHPVDERVMPLSYCYCCAGNFRYHLQNALKMKLKTKEIVSSPINSKGEKPCEFLFEIIEK